MLTLLTANPAKYAPFASRLERWRIVLETPTEAWVEPQTVDFGEAIAAKARAAAARCGRPVLVDDAGLVLESYRPFPGPLTSSVLSGLGPAGLERLVAGVSARARMECHLGCWVNGVLRHWTGAVAGHLDFSRPPRDPRMMLSDLFVPDAGPLDPQELPHRARALDALATDIFDLHLELESARETPADEVLTAKNAENAENAKAEASPETRADAASALGTPHSALGTPHSALGTPHSALGTPHSALGTPHSALGTPHSALGTPHSALGTPHSALRTPHSALGTPHSALGTPHSALRTPHSALGTPHSALGTPHSALGTPHSALGTPHSECPFCAEFEADGLSIFAQMTGDPLANRVVYEDEDFVVMPPLGQFIEGGLLLLTRRHVLSIARLPPALFDRLEALLRALGRALLAHWGQPPLVFEHGPAPERGKGLCCVDHAHFNIFPARLRLHPHLAGRMHLPVGSLAELTRLRRAEFGYLFVQENDGARHAYDGQDVPTQLVRRIITAELGLPQRWHWRDYPGLKELAATCKALKGQIHL